MTSLRREAIKLAESILVPAHSDNPQTQKAIDYAKEQAAKVVDAILSLRAFQATDEEQAEYNVTKPLSEEDVEFVNRKVDKMLELNLSSHKQWKGRDVFRDNHLHYADWWNKITNQNCGKKQQRSWMKAFTDWQDEELELPHLQESYNQDIGWKKIIADPNEITKKAVAIKAMQGKINAQPESRPLQYDESGGLITY